MVEHMPGSTSKKSSRTSQATFKKLSSVCDEEIHDKEKRVPPRPPPTRHSRVPTQDSILNEDPYYVVETNSEGGIYSDEEYGESVSEETQEQITELTEELEEHISGDENLVIKSLINLPSIKSPSEEEDDTSQGEKAVSHLVLL